MRVEELDTPGLIIDLDALEQNLDRYQRHFDSHGIGFRPHIKTHKSVAIARMQMARGAIGLTCQKLGEAEVMVAGGLDADILIPFNLIGRQKLDRLTALARRTRFGVDFAAQPVAQLVVEEEGGRGITVSRKEAHERAVRALPQRVNGDRLPQVPLGQYRLALGDGPRGQFPQSLEVRFLAHSPLLNHPCFPTAFQQWPAVEADRPRQ